VDHDAKVELDADIVCFGIGTNGVAVV